MRTATIQFPLGEQELQQLKREFPLLDFAHFPKSLSNIPDEIWSVSEIFFGERLNEEDLAKATELRWIHVPSPLLQRLCLKKIEELGNILISTSPEGNVTQIGEFVIANVLAFAKNLLHWKSADLAPSMLWDCKWRNNMWTLKDKIFLQIGLSNAGLEIARQAKCLGMIVWGVDHLSSIHRSCDKNFSFNDLCKLLPEVDIVSMTIPQGMDLGECKLSRRELTLMKDDSILCILGSNKHLDEEALYDLAMGGKFRGILLDTSYQTAIAPKSNVWNTPNLILTPGVAPRPKAKDREAFNLFRINLRQYLNGNYSDMLHLIGNPIAHLLD